MKIKWSIEQWELSTLRMLDKNARRMTKEAACSLRKSISKFGLCEPIVINVDGLIIGGHQRVRSLRSMKVHVADVYVPDRHLTDAECDELNIRLNKNVGEWDFDILANEWDEKDLVEWGFFDHELDGIRDESDPKPKVHYIKISFCNEQQMFDFESEMVYLIEKHQGCSYKIK